MATYNFDLLDLADGEYGDAAVTVLVGKKKSEAAAAAAKLAVDPAQQAAQEKAATGLKYSYYARLQHDNGVTKCEHEMKRLREILIKLRAEEEKLRQQGGNEARVSKLVEEQRKLRQEQRKIRMEEAKILPLRDAFYKEHGIPLPVKNKKSLGENADSVSNCDDANGNVCNNNDGSNKGDDAGTEADEKPREIVPASDQNVVPASVSENSARGAAQNGSSNGQGKGTFHKEKINGSEKRKKKASKKNNGNEPEKAKKQDFEAVKQPLTGYVKEEEKKTLAEYERMREERKKSSEASKTELRKVTAAEFKGCQVLEKKKLDDEEAIIKAEKGQPKVKEASKKEETAEAKGKEAATKDGKPKKVTIPLVDLSFRQPPRRVYAQEDGSSARGRFNGGFQGGSHDNSTEPRVSGRDDNGRAVPNKAGFHNGNGAPRSAYNGRGNGAPRGDYSGRRDAYRGNGGYGYGRGNGNYQGNGVYHQQSQGGQNQRRYPQRDNFGDRCNSAPAPDLAVEDMTVFPALPAPVSARATSPASAPATAPALSLASAPATAPAPSPAQA